MDLRPCALVQLQVTAKANITHKNGFNAGHPTVLLQFNKDFEVGGDKAEPTGSGSQVQPDWRAGNSEKGRRLVSLAHITKVK